MRLPQIEGVIRRRILVNFRVDPGVMQSQLPPRFRPKLHHDHSIAGICLIRLEQIRPRFVPPVAGVSSENAAHRIAVRWQAENGEREGVFIPRRDTSSLLNHLGGGRIFPGEHHRARFVVHDRPDSIDFNMESKDGEVAVRIRARRADRLPAGSSFSSVAEASAFFEPGSVGYSVTRDPRRLDGIELRTKGWSIGALDVQEVYSSWFADERRFPRGSIEFDCALLMQNVRHAWHSAEDLYV